MEDYCGSRFWDPALSWNTTDPFLSPCVEETAVALAPVAFLLVFGFIDVLNVRRSKCRLPLAPSSVNPFVLVKTVLSTALVAVYVAHLVRLAALPSESTTYFDVDWVAPSLQLAGYIIITILSLLTHLYGIRSSGVQFFFWFLSTLAQGVLFRTAVRKYDSDVRNKAEVMHLTRLIAFPLICIRFIQEWFGNDVLDNKGSRLRLGKPSPDKSSTFLSKILFLWYDSLAWTGYRRLLTRDDLWDLNPLDTSEHQAATFTKYWKQQEEKAARTGKKSGILVPIFKCFGLTFAFGALLKISADLLVFVQPEMVRSLVAHVTTNEEPAWKGYMYTATIVVATFMQALFNAASNKRALLIGMRIRAALSNAVFRKALVISNAAKRESTVGEIVNLMAVDAQKFTEMMPMINMSLGSPLQIAIAIWLLHNTLGASIFAGVGVLLLLIPTNAVVAIFARSYQMAQMSLKDERIKLTSEVLGGIKVLKLYGWEPSYQAQIEAIRAKEMVFLRKSAFLNVIIMLIFNIAPVLVTLASFATYALSDTENHILNAEKTFVALSLFNILRGPMIFLPMVISLLVQVMVSVNRLNNYLNKDELDKGAVTHDPAVNGDPITVQGATFSWGDESTTLQDIDFAVKKGELVAVVGTIGSGKSSLLCSILGDLKKHAGVVNTVGSIAYVSQGAWIQNASLRNNILFGDKFNGGRYDRVLEACALKTDLEILPGGDGTEIGEKGINLSGGQKQRVALARAAYKESSVYLLDDPLSAVDAHVGKHIFENLIGPTGLLRQSTRVLVTHGVSFLPHVDRIVVMKNGRVSESGTYKELLRKQGEFADFLLQHLGVDVEGEGAEADFDLDPDKLSVIQDLEELIEAEEAGVGADEASQRKSSANRESLIRILKRLPSKEERERRASAEGGPKPVRGASAKQARAAAAATLPPKQEEDKEKLVQEEAMAEGAIGLGVYLHYFQAGGLVLFVFAMFFAAGAAGLNAYANMWLSDWSTEATEEEFQTGKAERSTTEKYLIGYGSIAAVQALTSFAGTGGLALLSLIATNALHSEALGRVMRAPMSYFDTTLLGRLINRFAKDVDTTDNLVPLNLRMFVNMFFSVLATFVVISYTTPVFIAFIVPMAVLYVALQRFYVATSRQLKRLESVTRSPIYSHFGETVSGSTTIRAFGLEDEFVAESERRIDLNQKTYFPFISSNMWIMLRLEFMGGVIILATCIFSLLSRDSLNPGDAGLAITYSLNITGLLNFLTRTMSDLETNIVSVERVGELKEVPQEAAWEALRPGPAVGGDGGKPAPSTVAPDWPSKGEVRFDDYKTRYRPGLDLVLTGISCVIRPGEKIGVVGRTGAGKSSFTLALFRIIEAAGGRIYIDGVDISTLGLHELRKKITIIPQDPVLFSGTLRLNLDPFNEYSDEQVWKCLELAHLKPYVSTLAEGLQYVVEEEGKNFSVGQRQLICLARALLRKTRILVLDEATAAVDLETDDLIQATIRKEFAHSSVITIAHRLNTIMDSSRVMVLDKGQIKEFDTPEKLLADTGSVFWGMAHDAKLV